MRDGKPIPKKMAEAPQLRMGLELFYAAYTDLCGERTGMGDGPIGWSVIHEYAKANGFDEDQSEDLHYYIGQLDTAFRDFAKRKKGTGSKSDPTSGGIKQKGR